MEVSGKLREKEIVTELCDPCTVDNLSNQADGFCKDCEEFMCQTCFGYHLRARSCRNHVLDPLSKDQLQRKIRAREEKCKTHTSEPVKYYCSLHDFIGCGDCIVTGHGKCEPKFIRDIALNLEESSEFKSIISQLQKSDGETADSETRIARYREENKMLMAKAIRGIKVFRRDIDCWLDKMEITIEAEVRKVSDENENTFSQLQESIVAVNDDIDRINKLLDSNIHHDENLFMRMIECKPEVKVIDKTLSEIKSKLVFQRYRYEQGEEMKGMLMSLDKLGIMKVLKLTENEQSTEDVNMPPFATESEPEDVLANETKSTYNVKELWYPLRAELEDELENIRQKAVSEKEEKEQAYNKLKTELENELEKTKQMAVSEKEEKVSLQQAYNILKKELEAQEALLSKERENYIVMTKERDQTILLLKQHEQEIISRKDLNTSLNSQLDSRNKEYSLLEISHGQNNSIIESLQSELKKTRDDQERLSRQIRDLELHRESANSNIRDLQQQRNSAMRTISDLKVQLKQKDETIVQLRQEISSLSAKLDSCKKEYETFASQSQTKQKQDQTMYISLQSELKQIRENYDKDRERMNSQILDFLRQREYDFPDPRAAGFDVGKRVEYTGTRFFLKMQESYGFEGSYGTVTEVNPSGYVVVKWDQGRSDRCLAGDGGKYEVKLL